MKEAYPPNAVTAPPTATRPPPTVITTTPPTNRPIPSSSSPNAVTNIPVAVMVAHVGRRFVMADILPTSRDRAVILWLTVP